MTDGIIQKVKKKVLTKRLNKKRYSNMEMVLAFKEFEYELIAEIKKELSTMKYCGSSSYHLVYRQEVIETLIGDNQDG